MELGDIKKLIALFDKSDLKELELEENDSRIRLRKGADAESGAIRSEVSSSPLPQPVALPKPEPTPPQASVGKKTLPEGDNYVRVESPMVGTFYRSPAESEPAYVNEGDMVKKGQVLCIIEAMKLMNEIEAEVSGEIVAILPENAQAVEYGEPLFVIEKS